MYFPIYTVLDMLRFYNYYMNMLFLPVINKVSF